MYLRLLWFTGASQTDAASLTDKNVDRGNRVLSYVRRKLEGRNLPPACLVIGKGLEAVLHELPKTGALFPYIFTLDDRIRANYFGKLCKRSRIEGISLHSYRYSWAERAKVVGIPQRWAQAVLGHNSKAVHDAYARNALVVCPPIDEYNTSAGIAVLYCDLNRTRESIPGAIAAVAATRSGMLLRSVPRFFEYSMRLRRDGILRDEWWSESILADTLAPVTRRACLHAPGC